MYFDIDAHRNCFNTDTDEAYFWHGQTNGCGGPNNAMAIADENGGKTLDMCMLEHRDELERAGVRFKDNDDGTVSIDYGNTLDESKKFWDDCSQAFAEQSSGNVHVIEGTDMRPNGQSENDYPSVYNRIEHPTLEQNQQVNGITKINPDSRKEFGHETFDTHNEACDATGKSGSGTETSVASINGGGSHAPPVTAVDTTIPRENSDAVKADSNNASDSFDPNNLFVNKNNSSNGDKSLNEDNAITNGMGM